MKWHQNVGNPIHYLKTWKPHYRYRKLRVNQVEEASKIGVEKRSNRNKVQEDMQDNMGQISLDKTVELVKKAFDEHIRI